MGNGNHSSEIVSGEPEIFSQLRSFEGEPVEFWPKYLSGLIALAKAERGGILIRNQREGWKPIVVQPQGAKILDDLNRSAHEFDQDVKLSTRNGVMASPVMVGEEATGHRALINLTPEGSNTQALALLYLPEKEALSLADVLVRLGLAREIATSYSLQRRLSRAEDSAGSFASILDLLQVMDARQRYLEAAMTLCNEVAARFRCDRVSLGFLVNNQVRLQAISHTEKIEKKMEAVLSLEEVMEEALDQDEEVMIPSQPGSDTVVRCHNKFAGGEGSINLASIPMRRVGEPEGVLTLERSGDEFSETEMQTLRALCDQVVTRLEELRKRDRWMGARAWATIREKASGLVGVENTGWKLLSLIIALGLCILVFGGSNYRVEAPFILKSDTLAQVPASFDGYIEQVHFHVGDQVPSGEPLLDLDQKELLLQEASERAELLRHRSDAQRAQAEGELAKMRSAQAMADQSEARIEMIEYRLEQSVLSSPFDGVVVEGDLRERIGAPVKQGEVLLKIAQLDRLFAEGKVHERNINYLDQGASGEIAFASRPNERFPVILERIEPLAMPEEEGNMFVIRCQLKGPVPDWWRPGMSGLCKIDSERRSYLWMLTHRTVEYLRMKLWW